MLDRVLCHTKWQLSPNESPALHVDSDTASESPPFSLALSLTPALPLPLPFALKPPYLATAMLFNARFVSFARETSAKSAHVNTATRHTNALFEVLVFAFFPKM